MYSNQLIKELGLLSLKLKGTAEKDHEKPPQEQTTSTAEIEPISPSKVEQPKLDKNEFRLLVKMLQAIGHDCVYDQIHYDGKTVTYQLPNKKLVFSNINIKDSSEIMNLSSLQDLLTNQSLKRPVWEKLKTI